MRQNQIGEGRRNDSAKSKCDDAIPVLLSVACESFMGMKRDKINDLSVINRSEFERVGAKTTFYVLGITL